MALQAFKWNTGVDASTTLNALKFLQATANRNIPDVQAAIPRYFTAFGTRTDTCKAPFWNAV